MTLERLQTLNESNRQLPTYCSPQIKAFRDSIKIQSFTVGDDDHENDGNNDDDYDFHYGVSTDATTPIRHEVIYEDKFK